ncbi:hypothetical protein Pcinc_022974 [Petrolisthes cinctipes]|uniref:Neurotrypsin n=1 Tax=Petrolisthes cinctipes TaxID=88211 RepID=A0AAE1FEK3_PETCI|nr:hypothetical protein Pcinc_022974 [Petrolisthes cinctipes]
MMRFPLSIFSFPLPLLLFFMPCLSLALLRRRDEPLDITIEETNEVMKETISPGILQMLIEAQTLMDNEARTQMDSWPQLESFGGMQTDPLAQLETEMQMQREDGRRMRQEEQQVQERSNNTRIKEKMIGVQRVRVVNGGTPNQGNLQVNVAGMWGYVCDDGFGFVEADIACRSLGYERALTFTRNNHFGSKKSGWWKERVKLFVDEVDCSGVEGDPSATLKDCISFPLGHHDCLYSEIAGVVCATSSQVSLCPPNQFSCPGNPTSCFHRDTVCDGNPDCPNASDEAESLCEDEGVTRVRMERVAHVPGASLGRVEVKRQGQWGTVCDQGFTAEDAKVVCRSLGHEGGWAVPFYGSYLGRGSGPVWLQAPQCRGDEAWLGQCNNAIWRNYSDSCHNHFQDISVFCYDQRVKVRLVEGGRVEEGRVEVQLGGQWGTLCDTSFDHLDAQVVCSTLGLGGEAVAVKGAGEGSKGPMWPLLLDCQGTETNLHQCRIRIALSPCPRTAGAGVTCTRRHGTVDQLLREALPGECGVPEDASAQFLLTLAKVRGGFIPTRFDSPWLVFLRLARPQRELLCGGSILAEDLVVTAAHCVDGLSINSFVVTVGNYNSNYFENLEEEFYVERRVIHEHFNRSSLNNDIALLKLQRKGRRGIR